MLIRQGDVALIPSTAPAPTGPARPVVLVRGLSTGHAHTLTAAVPDADPPRRVAVLDGCVLTHPEHTHLAVPAGTYDVRRQFDGTDTTVED